MESAAALPEGLFFDLISAKEVDTVYELEAKSFPPEEAATIEKLRYRQENAPELFLGAFVPHTGGGRALLGYVNGVLSSEATLTSESMSTHVLGAHTVLIHGVCVASDSRRRGIASALLAEYQRRLEAAGSYERALLIAHEDKLGFYERFGFKSRGLSNISFAGVTWLELEWTVPVEVDRSGSAPHTILPGLLESLQGRSNPQLQGQLLSAFTNGILDVSETEGDRTINRYDLLCVNDVVGVLSLGEG
ncbi:hypothetical protein B0F90DRAFT_1817702 [Multifurca ochricompacta]|uniref:N-acetyltransferase domain-containing protein n=1 Tax=Multifurca ochricompacta TaxID=376703 RepID=A0AAD4M5A7_9AGAM|nr:hypothetical protein B0F90DRAFT_1817702 [Multifurca ochricompacta]